MKFNATRILGRRTKVIIDENAQKFIVSFSDNWKEQNPDVIDLSQVTGCDLRIDESQEEKMRKDNKGNRVSYNPRRVIYKYNFWLTIYVNHPYFNEIKFMVNNDTVLIEPPTGRIFMQGGSKLGRGNVVYRQCEEAAEEIREALTHPKIRMSKDDTKQKNQNAIQGCPFCGEAIKTNTQKFCESCGSPIQQ